MKLIIDIDEQTYNKVRRYITELEIKDILTVRKAIRKGVKLETELEEIKSEMQDYGCSFIIAKRIDLASAVSNCIKMVDNHIKELNNE